MKADFKFVKTHGGITRFASAVVDAEPAAQWSISFAEALPMIPRQYVDNVRSGIENAIAAHEKRSSDRFSVIVTEFTCTAGDVRDDVVECTSAVAAWKSFGHVDADAPMELVDGRWRVAFREPRTGAESV